MQTTGSFSDELEQWLETDGDKTLGDVQEVFGERTFAVTILLLMAPSALPLPTGGVTLLLEAATVLLAAEMVAGRRTVWLPASWHDHQLGALLTERAIPAILRFVRWCERWSRPTRCAPHGPRVGVAPPRRPDRSTDHGGEPSRPRSPGWTRCPPWAWCCSHWRSCSKTSCWWAPAWSSERPVACSSSLSVRPSLAPCDRSSDVRGPRAADQRARRVERWNRPNRKAHASSSTPSSPSAPTSTYPPCCGGSSTAPSDLVDATYGALGVLDESRTRLSQFITVGIDDGPRGLRSATCPRGTASSGCSSSTPSRCASPTSTEHPDSYGFPPNHPPMRSFLGVPIRVRDEVFGNLYLTDKTTAEVFTDVDEELVVGLAAAAGVAIENARSARQGPGAGAARGPRADRPRPPRHRHPAALRHRACRCRAPRGS